MALLAACWALTAATSAAKYNVLYFIADDLRPDFLGPYGQDYVRHGTPSRS